MECLSNSSGTTVEAVIKKPQCFRLQFISSLAELENDADKKFLQNLENGAAIGYETDLWNFPEVFTGKTKRRVYDEQRRFQGNYKTVLGKEESLQKAICEDSDEGLFFGALHRV